MLISGTGLRDSVSVVPLSLLPHPQTMATSSLLCAKALKSTPQGCLSNRYLNVGNRNERVTWTEWFLTLPRPSDCKSLSSLPYRPNLLQTNDAFSSLAAESP